MSLMVKLVPASDDELTSYTCTFTLTTTVKARSEEEARYLAVRELWENIDMYEFAEEQIIEDRN